MKEIQKFYFNDKEVTVSLVSIKGEDKSCNQDNVILFHNDNCILIASSDGLGSALHSEVGSRSVNEVAIEIVKEGFDSRTFASRVKEEWLKKIMFNPNACDTTFKFIYINKTDLYYGGIGDGWLVGIIDGQFYSTVNNNEFSNQTESMLSIGYNENFKIFHKEYQQIDVLSLATDGFSEDFDKSQIQNFLLSSCDNMIVNSQDYVDQLEEFIINWPIQTNRDDKSIVILGVNNVK